MKRCPITYQPIPKAQTFSKAGLALLSKSLTKLLPIPYSAEELRHEAMNRAPKMSIQGVQPKLSAQLNLKEQCLQIVDTGGKYIIKPPHAYYPNLPENEDLTMRLANAVKIQTPIHGLIWASDNSLSYFIKRFDRYGRSKKRSQEDFAQLSGRTRDTKYDSSIEQVIEIVERYCTFPAIEKIKLFKLVVFSFLVGNEDMHLKNFSLLGIDDKIVISPAYDLLSATLVIPAATEEMALPLKGKKKNITCNDLLRYLAKDRLKLADKVIEEELILFSSASSTWQQLIEISFLPEKQKSAYWEIVKSRLARIQ